MRQKLFYLAVAILAFAVGTFLALYFFSQKKETQPVLQNETVSIPSNQIVQTEPKAEKTINFINFDDLKVKGTGLDSIERTVYQKIRKSQKIRNDGYNDCAEFNEKTLLYSGLELHLLGSKDRKYKVYSMKVSSPNWVTASGIKVGDEMEKVIATFGKGHKEVENSGLVNLYYGDYENVGGARFSFRNNKLVKIWAGYTLC